MMEKAQEIGVAVFCRALVDALVMNGDKHLTIGDPKVERALPRVLDLLWEEAHKQFRAKNRDASHQLVRIIEELSPDPNSGVFDGFWSALHQLQPFVVTIANPMFREMELNPSKQRAEQDLSELPSFIRDVSRQSAKLIAGVHGQS